MNPITRLLLSDDQEQDFNIFFSARNDRWVEKLSAKDECECASACQVFGTNPTKSPKEPIFEEISALQRSGRDSRDERLHRWPASEIHRC
jgi:hypothetical protein